MNSRNVKTDVETKFVNDLAEVVEEASNLEFDQLLQKFFFLVGLLSDPKNGEVLTILDKVLDVETKAFLDLCVIAFDPDPFTALPLFGGNEIMGNSYNLNNYVSTGGGRRKREKAAANEIVPYSPRRLSKAREPEEQDNLMLSLGASAGGGGAEGAKGADDILTAVKENVRDLTPEQIRAFGELYRVREQGIIIKQHMEMKQEKWRTKRNTFITYSMFAMSVGGAFGHTAWYSTEAVAMAAVGTGAKMQQGLHEVAASGASLLAYASSWLYTTNMTEVYEEFEAAREGAAATAAATIDMGHAHFDNQYVQYVMMGCAAGLITFLVLKCIIDLAGKNFGLSISTPLVKISMHSNRPPETPDYAKNPFMQPVVNSNGASSRKNQLRLKSGGTNKIRNNSSSKNNNNNRNNKSNKKKNKKYRKNNSNKKKKKNTKNKTKK